MLSASKAGSMGKFGRRLAIERHVRPTLVAVPPLGFDDRLGFLQGFEPVQVQTFVPERSIKTFDMAVVGWFSWPTEIDASIGNLAKQQRAIAHPPFRRWGRVGTIGEFRVELSS